MVYHDLYNIKYPATLQETFKQSRFIVEFEMVRLGTLIKYIHS